MPATRGVCGRGDLVVVGVLTADFRAGDDGARLVEYQGCRFDVPEETVLAGRSNVLVALNGATARQDSAGRPSPAPVGVVVVRKYPVTFAGRFRRVDFAWVAAGVKLVAVP